MGLVLLGTACGGVETSAGPYLDHQEQSDLQPAGEKADGIAPVFDRNRLVEDAFFSDTTMDAAAVQAFLESTPYGHRCFLADEELDGKPFSEVLVEEAVAESINPMMLLVRMQVESSLISRSSRPGTSTLNFALGCGCADSTGCGSFRGLQNQLSCGAQVLREHFDSSAAGTGEWRKGHAAKTSDGLTVVPANDATAALYAYTPWVLTGHGGNWLVWNVLHKYAGFLDLHLPQVGFVGSTCTADDQTTCSFHAGHADGRCDTFDVGSDSFGFCTLPCEGLCPDQGSVKTFCVALAPDQGGCVVKAGSANDDCTDIPGTAPVELDRYVGSSSAGPATATVCMPADFGG